ncbi:MAG: hypothetical protein PHW79_05875 [Candidatus Marinimicrobia bacterium]|jgi:hypothetical protein|nr:hypothetical protein [Candidatus Neomarinimicrobiota bacterium]
MDNLETENVRNADMELIENIRSKFDEVKELVEGMKSKLPDIDENK